jgi:hypothetical protein
VVTTWWHLVALDGQTLGGEFYAPDIPTKESSTKERRAFYRHVSHNVGPDSSCHVMVVVDVIEFWVHLHIIVHVFYLLSSLHRFEGKFKTAPAGPGREDGRFQVPVAENWNTFRGFFSKTEK